MHLTLNGVGHNCINSWEQNVQEETKLTAISWNLEGQLSEWKEETA